MAIKRCVPQESETVRVWRMALMTLVIVLAIMEFVLAMTMKVEFDADVSGSGLVSGMLKSGLPEAGDSYVNLADGSVGLHIRGSAPAWIYVLFQVTG